ncbi:MAG TPA: hypothetical protein VFF78_04895 [Anaerolineaceae bacterium]|nr:hypothetical protein [Anaerolineaceae bacterium]
MTDQPEFQQEECCQEECCQETPLSEIPSESETPVTNNSVNVKMVEVIGASFLGIISLILLVVLLRSQRRNRHLTAELAKRAPRLVLLDRPHKKRGK